MAARRPARRDRGALPLPPEEVVPTYSLEELAVNRGIL